MERLERALRALNFYNDALADHRERICKNVSALGACTLMPFVVMHVLAERWVMLGVNVAMIGLMGATAFVMHRGGRPPVPFLFLGCAMVAGVLVAVFKQGVPGILWSYPALFIGYFILERRAAMLLGAVLSVGVSTTVAATLDPALALRVLISQAFVVLMINVVLNVIGDLQQALVAQTITDPLTGAYNRRHLESQLGLCVVAGGAAGSDSADALLVIDIDHFKRINDTHGHDVGDEVLRKVVTAVSTRKRRSDLLFRMGGEEFLLLLPGASLAQAQQMAEELRARLAQSELLPGQAVTVSIGVSALRQGQTADAWIKSADNALYRAKRGGRNRVELAENEFTASGG